MAEGVTSERGFVLKPLTFVGLGIVIVCAVALAYVGGVMSGRASAEQQLRVEVREAYVAGIEAERNKDENREGILQPEELEFSRELRNDNRLGKPLPPKPVQALPAVDPEPQTAASASREKAAEDAVEKAHAARDVSAGQAPPTQSPQPSAVLAAQNPSGLQDYVYQVAAMKNEDAADALRQRLEGRGLRTYMKRERKLLLIQVKLRGDNARSKELLDILESMHLGRPILISQKPAVY